MTKGVQALVKENKRLREQVKELEKGWKKIEKALGSNVTRARRAVKKGGQGGQQAGEQSPQLR
jgi:cell division septum initiation protein DivIVA